MATQTDYYRVLGVPKDASDADIRKAFRKIAKDNHPDRNPDNPAAGQRFKEANEAYGVLSDTQKRELYDKYGELGLREGFDPKAYEQSQQGFGGFGGFGGGGFQDFDLSDLFGGRRNAAPRQRSVQPIELSATITFDQALHGTNLSFTYNRSRVCGVCRGAGGMNQRVCSECQGRGLTSFQDQVAVNVPQGARTGDTIRLAKRGNIDARGTANDLVLELQVTPDSRFEQSGIDLTAETTVTPAQLLLGGRHEIVGPWGPITMNLKAGFDPRKLQRVPGRGMRRGSKKGDLFVRFQVGPQRLSDEQRAALESLLGEDSATADDEA